MPEPTLEQTAPESGETEIETVPETLPNTQATTTTTQAEVPPVAEPAKPVTTVAVTAEQLQEFVSWKRQLDDINRVKAEEIEAKERERAMALAKAGDAETALKTTDARWEAKLAESNSKYTTLQEQFNRAEMNRVLTDLMPIERFHGSDALADARAKIAANLEIIADSTGTPTVREKGTMRPAAEVIAEKLASAQFAHFLKPTTGGGAGGGGGKPGDTQAQQGPAPGSLEWIAAEYKAKQQKLHTMGLTMVSRN